MSKLSIEEALEYLDSDPMVCFVCGRGYQRLGRHLSMSHGIDSRDYCEEYGIPWTLDGGQGLSTRADRAQMGASLKANRKHIDHMKVLHKVAPKRSHHSPINPLTRRALQARSRTAPRQCPTCSETFRPCRVGVRFCSRTCAQRDPAIRAAWKAKRTKPPQPCSNCGQLYKPLRRGRCDKCRKHWAAYGVERSYG